MQPPPNAKELLRKLALQAGFPLFGVAPAIQAPNSKAFQFWLLAGHHADMHWLYTSRHLRSNPQALLPNAQSIIALAIPYFQGTPLHSPSHQPTGQIARYAWGSDYHIIIPHKLQPLLDQIKSWGFSAQLFCDSSPLLERDYAALAGIGWQGKSTMLLNRQHGKWILLSCILTDLPLTPDEPAKNYCGSCQRCILACPTRAIGAPYQLDARRCISYLTIENKGPIPHEFRRAIGNRIFGCDDCLLACPWNRFAQISHEAAFSTHIHLLQIPLRDYLTMTEHQFRSLFAQSPILRIRLHRLQRNAVIALGNTGSPNDIPALQSFAATQSDWLQEHAHWAIQEIRSRSQTSPDPL